jgi:hypothetical protein
MGRKQDFDLMVVKFKPSGPPVARQIMFYPETTVRNSNGSEAANTAAGLEFGIFLIIIKSQAVRII